MLRLKLPTDPRWVNLAKKSIEEILVDHAFCEQKAATSCISLIVTYSYLRPIVESVTPIVREEWDHFSLVLEELHKNKLLSRNLYVVITINSINLILAVSFSECHIIE